MSSKIEFPKAFDKTRRELANRYRALHPSARPTDEGLVLVPLAKGPMWKEAYRKLVADTEQFHIDIQKYLENVCKADSKATQK